ncbi:phosphatidylinositol 4-kinase-like protein STT4 [Westerdykella ornata]|uniref:1-phosphatidylinositol 4-kinase n=1 Tax=Westerdykella ornata TaxID=318751 RepID=A0A6A6JWC8_WESOR|nr:phosphatidylinositol 4-kinase-like protein STT4 [Westerdykella ornata]KAF2280911.1 phosphatidylinositol 4-kinase-like protein STT4 [Westerdykella ornata]
MGRSIRREALQKLAQLSVQSTASSAASPDLSKLYRRFPTGSFAQNGTGTVGKVSVAGTPMKIPELEAILALCKAAPFIQSHEVAQQLLTRLSPYLSESYAQVLFPSPGLRDIDPSPYEVLTYNLTAAILSIGIHHNELHPEVTAAVTAYLSGWTDGASKLSVDHAEDGESNHRKDRELTRILTQGMSFLGFLDAAAEHAAFWRSTERLQLVEDIRGALSETFLVSLETALSVVRNSGSHQHGLRDWRHYAKHYAATGRPLGAMSLHDGFLKVMVACASLLVRDPNEQPEKDILEFLHSSFDNIQVNHTQSDDALVNGLTEIAVAEMSRLDNDLDYLHRVGSVWQQRQGAAVKAKVLLSYLCCTIYDDEVAEPDLLLTWLDGALNDPVQASDENLACTVLKSMTVLAKVDPSIASTLSRTLPRAIVQGGFVQRTANVAADSLASVLSVLPQDAIITTLYSLGNVINASPLADRGTTLSSSSNGGGTTPRNTVYDAEKGASTISLTPSDAEEPIQVYITIVHTITTVARSCNDEKIAALALSMLIQKHKRVSKPVDAKIITDSALLSLHSGTGEFRMLLKYLMKQCHESLVEGDTTMLQAVMDARRTISKEVSLTAPEYDIYLTHLLDIIVSKGDAYDAKRPHLRDSEMAAQEISQLLCPLAELLVRNANNKEAVELGDDIIMLQRDAWFNLVIHGFDLTSELGRQYLNELRTLAHFSAPLINEEMAGLVESDIELNTVLRRSKSAEHVADQKKRLAQLLPGCESDVKSLNYAETVFMNTAYLVEKLRATSGDCTKVLVYFLDPKLRTGAVGNCMFAVATAVTRTYVQRTLSGKLHSFSTPYLAQQLATIFAGCCHRIAKVQEAAVACADFIIQNVPSTLCQKSALFALLELLSIMWSSCLERDTDEYTWRSTFTSMKSNIAVELSDDYAFRNDTLTRFHRRAKGWVRYVLDLAPLDIKGLLQTYLSEFDDKGVYGHISLGRSFALEMGSVIPSTDQRLGAIEQQGFAINTASDFISQYTTRQEYKFVDGLNDQEEEWLRTSGDRRGAATFTRRIEDATTLLIDLETRTSSHKAVSIAELRDILRRAAALLCRAKSDQPALVHHLVGIPFAVFSKQSIKLGISLWMTVIKENPRMEPRILIELAQCWESTIRKGQGIFSDFIRHPDPFYGKQEFAPTDKEAVSKRQQSVYNTIAPHFRLLQLLSSHFNASRLCNADVESVYNRLIHITLDALGSGCSQPLAREAYFHTILLGLRILRSSTTLTPPIKWRLQDRILTAGLAWFAKAPQWSFGGNRHQIKAETQILADIQADLQAPTPVSRTSVSPANALTSKQELLDLLLTEEQSRLRVWLFPLDHEKKHHFGSGYKGPVDATVTAHLKTAWAENPALAVHLAQRFPRMSQEVRWLVLNFPHKVLDEPNALELLLGDHLPSDVSFQLRYLLYWASVNPITAVTYFLPAYKNNAFIIQYAMRALESHSVDVTFFYVPQIVQTLRYDALGYVERYIIETAKFSQLFAHQIIWNMKANAYKDEDSQVPDAIKPTLDKVMDSLESSFSVEDREFYEREFSFFNEVTGISGKLRPFIKSPKPEKKQKIEEELRKIHVEVGVYLPSNPEGIVVGIDRKSGKPLQSHAKAPYMATFRIRKSKLDTSLAEPGPEAKEGGEYEAATSKENTYEVWQSAIFKVGDDCRQDVLALQMIATFRGIFNNVGLDVWVYPYRVTATAPGCGVIDVLPNSISRDMLGRESVNGLHEYFVNKYGGEDSIRFQEARSNFVKSMAAYSVISYLLQFKDRHNGNIMIDDAGHIIHIDFGFCFDIAPGGIKFERAPFKLTTEMIDVMGGSQTSQSYRWFEELTIKAFLASRQHAEHLIHIVRVMLDSGLPCFKPETIANFRERFVLDKGEREAAEYMRGLVQKSAGSYSTGGYDRFQQITNGIPY